MLIPECCHLYFFLTVISPFCNIGRLNCGGCISLQYRISYDCVLSKDSIAFSAYLSAGALSKKDKVSNISERHRHRYEVNTKYIDQLEKAGLVFSGKSPDGVLMEIAELPKKDHPFYLGTQFHPEFKSRPLVPHPLFSAFIKASSRTRIDLLSFISRINSWGVFLCFS